MKKGLIIRGNPERKIILQEHTLFTKTQISILAYFSKNNNKPTTYIEISRAYVSSSYSNYKTACNSLVKGSWIEKQKDGKYNVTTSKWRDVKRGIIQIERRLPYFDSFLKKLGKRRKR